MKFTALLSAFTAVSAAPFFWNRGTTTSYNATACASYISAQASSMITLTTTVGEYAAAAKQNDIVGLLKLQVNTQKLIDLIKDTGSTINASCPCNKSITASQALTMASTLLQLPGPVNVTMTALIEKKPVFAHAILYFVSLEWLVKADLNKVVSAIDGMVGAITINLNAAAATLVPTISGKILAPIKAAQAAYA